MLIQPEFAYKFLHAIRAERLKIDVMLIRYDDVYVQKGYLPMCFMIKVNHKQKYLLIVSELSLEFYQCFGVS